jgi:hypothetical protein
VTHRRHGLEVEDEGHLKDFGSISTLHLHLFLT